MLNKQGKKVRLTFKMELDQLWIGTQQRTDKVPMSSIKAVVSEPIADHDDYYIVVSPALFYFFDHRFSSITVQFTRWHVIRKIISSAFIGKLCG
jgi:hypothetical protein